MTKTESDNPTLTHLGIQIDLNFLTSPKIYFQSWVLFISMSASGPELGLASMQRIIRKSGAERVSDDAANELREVLEEIAEKIAKHAVELSVHAGRKTIKLEDIRLATKNVLRSQNIL
jgi:DNA-binding protein